MSYCSLLFTSLNTAFFGALLLGLLAPTKAILGNSHFLPENVVILLQGTTNDIERYGYLAEWTGEQITETHGIHADYQSSIGTPQVSILRGIETVKTYPINKLTTPDGIQFIVDDFTKVKQAIQRQQQEAARLEALREKLSAENAPIHNREAYQFFYDDEYIPKRYLAENTDLPDRCSPRQFIEHTAKLLLSRMDSKGIPINQLSEALITGRFTPDMLDLELLWENLGRPTGTHIINNIEIYEDVIRHGIDTAKLIVPNYDFLKNTYEEITDWHVRQVTPQMIDRLADWQMMSFDNLYRHLKWRELFGALSPNKRYVTYVNEELVVLSPSQIRYINEENPYVYLRVDNRKSYRHIQLMRSSQQKSLP